MACCSSTCLSTQNGKRALFLLRPHTHTQTHAHTHTHLHTHKQTHTLSLSHTHTHIYTHGNGALFPWRPAFCPSLISRKVGGRIFRLHHEDPQLGYHTVHPLIRRWNSLPLYLLLNRNLLRQSVKITLGVNVVTVYPFTCSFYLYLLLNWNFLCQGVRRVLVWGGYGQ